MSSDYLNNNIYNNLNNNFYNNLDIYLIGLYCISVCICIYNNMLKKCNNIY